MTYLIFEAFQFLANSFIDFYNGEVVSTSDFEEELNIELRVHNGSWYETLNLFHVSSRDWVKKVESWGLWFSVTVYIIFP